MTVPCYGALLIVGIIIIIIIIITIQNVRSPAECGQTAVDVDAGVQCRCHCQARLHRVRRTRNCSKYRQMAHKCYVYVLPEWRINILNA